MIEYSICLQDWWVGFPKINVIIISTNAKLRKNLISKLNTDQIISEYFKKFQNMAILLKQCKILLSKIGKVIHVDSNNFMM